MDDLYREEFDRWQDLGAVDVRRAFSRVAPEEADVPGSKYVQHSLWAEREEVKKLWGSGARVYVCGSRHVGEEVKQVMGKIILGSEVTEQEIAQWYEGVRNDRYATDVFD